MEDLIALKYDRLRFSDDEFYDFCTQNDNLKFEREPDGTILIMPNTGGITGNLNFELNVEIGIWNRIAKTGKAFDSSTMFRLPSTAVRSADVAWVANHRWEALSVAQQTKFPPLCPDFVIELMSNSDNLKEAQRKMEEDWIGNGCRLGWLIDPKNQQVYIYRPQQAVILINTFDNPLLGEDVLAGFVLDLKGLAGEGM
ncbi:MAG: Uma2 family endonuclease [Cytophagia bacterium]|nr:MAG: Uma2 family endonuclease [Cytophagales bacterium]TAG40430.1 MAG: Uma2 family endonuclease [Cytophagia bacterium]TAG53559.1 MAG: Uma2 family endonuclease [Runella slithyformis]TAG81969.1 MAG: Uma2 family endonuclease [Cytophagales bacterium]